MLVFIELFVEKMCVWKYGDLFDFLNEMGMVIDEVVVWLFEVCVNEVVV